MFEEALMNQNCAEQNVQQGLENVGRKVGQFKNCVRIKEQTATVVEDDIA